MRFTPAKDIQTENVRIGKRKCLILRNRNMQSVSAGLLWIHGGGYITGMKEMVYSSRAFDLVRKYGITVLAPDYRLAWTEPYPAALDDCMAALLYMKEHAPELGIRSDQIMVGGESAGGGLCAAVCLKARDEGSVRIAYQMPLYPMIDCRDTETSKDNHGRVWNTKRNHFGWNMYLKNTGRSNIPVYASAALCQDYHGLPPAYSFVGDGEPFLQETKDYIRHLQEAGIPAEMDIWHSDMHAFDMLKPKLEISRQAAARFEEHFVYALMHYYAPQEEI